MFTMAKIGWLPKRPSIPRERETFGVDLEPTLPTRWEEYYYARQLLIGGEEAGLGPFKILDAACGFQTGWHVMPLIAGEFGEVEALDLRQADEDYPEHPNVNRVVGDMTALPYENDTFDLYFNISVLEHVTAEERVATIAEMKRVLKPDSAAFLSADAFDPLLWVELLEPDHVEVLAWNDEWQHLQPPVSVAYWASQSDAR